MSRLLPLLQVDTNIAALASGADSARVVDRAQRA